MRYLFGLVSILLFHSTKAQTSLHIATDKTTSLIFPLEIKHVDRGTKNVLVLSVKEAPNTLLLKAATKGFSETNLSVVTADGTLYSFAVSYDPNPAILVHYVPINKETSMAGYARMILDNPKTIHGIAHVKWDMRSEVSGIYIRNDHLYYCLQLQNQSSIPFDVALIRFYITDKRKAKRTAIQENEIKPLYILGNTKRVESAQNNSIVVVLEKFTIPDAKFLGIEIMEKNGGRHLFMKVKNNKIIQAIPLPDIN